MCATSPIPHEMKHLIGALYVEVVEFATNCNELCHRFMVSRKDETMIIKILKGIKKRKVIS